jgi:5-(carboxyamino)imidazole ribonucleotide mutase
MLASLTSVPVIGVPVALQHLDGMDSLLSIVQMPGGVPVAAVGVGNAKNGALLAARIIASGGSADDLRIRAALDDLRVAAAHKAMASGDALRKRPSHLKFTPRRPSFRAGQRQSPLPTAASLKVRPASRGAGADRHVTLTDREQCSGC